MCSAQCNNGFISTFSKQRRNGSNNLRPYFLIDDMQKGPDFTLPWRNLYSFQLHNKVGKITLFQCQVYIPIETDVLWLLLTQEC